MLEIELHLMVFSLVTGKDNDLVRLPHFPAEQTADHGPAERAGAAGDQNTLSGERTI